MLELAEADLNSILHGRVFLRNKQIIQIMYNILCSMKYIHSANLVHRDIKPANILIYSDCSIRLADFGLSRSLEGVQNTL